MEGELFIIGTPIGNLSDLSERAKETLKNIDFLLVEDSRVSIKLLNHLEISVPMKSYHEHNEAARAKEVIASLKGGARVGIISDAGMPCISDPGETIVSLCHEEGIKISCVPGPSAAITALAASGISTKRFLFEGFLPIRTSTKSALIEGLEPLPHTLIFYEGPHRLLKTLISLRKGLGDREIAICRELTKRYEQIWKTSIEEAVSFYSENPPRGEFVLVVAGASPKEENQKSIEELATEAAALIKGGMPPSEAAKRVAKGSDFSKSEIYKTIIKKEE